MRRIGKRKCAVRCSRLFAFVLSCFCSSVFSDDERNDPFGLIIEFAEYNCYGTQEDPAYCAEAKASESRFWNYEVWLANNLGRVPKKVVFYTEVLVHPRIPVQFHAEVADTVFTVKLDADWQGSNTIRFDYEYELAQGQNSDGGKSSTSRLEVGGEKQQIHSSGSGSPSGPNPRFSILTGHIQAVPAP